MDDKLCECLKGILVEIFPDFEHTWKPVPHQEPHYEPEDSDAEE